MPRRSISYTKTAIEILKFAKYLSQNISDFMKQLLSDTVLFSSPSISNTY